MTFGFVDNSQASLEGAVAGALWSAGTWVVGSVIQGVSGLINVVQGQQAQQSTQSVGVTGTVAFEPWGPDPYEEVVEPDKPVVFPPPDPVPDPIQQNDLVTQQVVQVQKAQHKPSPPQQQLTPEFVPTPIPNVPLPAGAGQIGGVILPWYIEVGGNLKATYEYGFTKGRAVKASFDKMVFTYEPFVDDVWIKYRPAIIASRGTRVVDRFVFDRELDTLPKRELFDVEIEVTADDGQKFKSSLVRSAVAAGGKLLPYTAKPYIPAEFEPETEPELEPETETLTEQDIGPLVPLVPTRVLPDIKVPLDPNSPNPIPAVDENGKPVKVPPIPVIPRTQHVINNITNIYNTGPSPTLKGIASEVGRIEQKTAELLKNVGGNGPNWAELLFLLTQLVGFFEPDYPGTKYVLNSVCEKDENGESVAKSVEEEIPSTDSLSAILLRLDALVPLLQGQKDFKQPICGSIDEGPVLEGDFRTISFRSDETSPYGKSRLRKRFRYRSVSGNDLGAVVDHWKDFSFEGGPYRVRWVGGPWRSPEIWAASEAEGQRVIQHAAAEAGVSPLEGGRWSTRLSGSGRQGVPGTMRVDTTGGFYWITARDGSDLRPIVAKT